MKYRAQEKDYSCGANSLRNVLIHFKLASVTEETVRKACKTSEEHGTTEAGLLEGAEHFGLESKEWETVSKDIFKRKVIKALKEGRTLIVNTDALWHWVTVLEYKNKRVKIIDSMYKTVNKSIEQWITLRSLSDMCLCYDRGKDRKTYYGIELWMEDEPE